MNINYYKHIQGIKGLAAMGVMLGHVLSDFHIAYGQEYDALNTIWTYCFCFFQNNVAMFAVVSGYVFAKKEWNLKTGEFIKKLVHRYFRFAVPILASCLFIIIIQREVGYVDHATDYFTLKDAFKYSFIDLFIGKSYFNGVYWMLFQIFWGSILVQIFCFFNNRNSNAILSICGAFLLLVFTGRILGWVSVDVLLGGGLGILTKKLKLSEQFCTFGIIVVEVCAIISRNIPICGEYWLYGSVIYCLLLLLFIDKSRFIKKIFGWNVFSKLGDLSFWIYCIHCPIILSFTSIVSNYYSSIEIRGLRLFLINAFVTTAITVFLATIFKYTEEKIKNFSLFLKNRGYVLAKRTSASDN